MNPHDIFVFEYRGVKLTYRYKLFYDGLIYILKPDQLLRVIYNVRQVVKFEDLKGYYLSWKLCAGTFKKFKYLGRLSEELIEDILFMEELGK